MVNLVTNGTFSGAVIGNTDRDPAGWTITEKNSNDVQVIAGALNFNAASGTSLDGQASQSVTGVPIGETVNFSFDYSEAQADRSISYTILDGNGNVIHTATTAASGNYSFSFTATTNNYTIVFRDLSTGRDQPNAIIDNVVFDVPFVVCFARHSLILTGNGEVAVEDLQVGDMVMTRDNGLQAIRWISSQTVTASAALAPILIRAGALGNETDLLVSPQHRMLIADWRAELMFGQTEVLVAAKDLVNDHNILRAPSETVEYFHFMFDSHQIVRANGAWSESYFPGEWSLGAVDAAARAELFAIFPELETDTASYGPAARPSLKSHEARLLETAA